MNVNTFIALLSVLSFYASVLRTKVSKNEINLQPKSSFLTENV